MSGLSDILSNMNPVTKVVDTIAGLATKYFPSEEDRKRFEADIYAQTAGIQIELQKAQVAMEDEFTRRQEADMQSDSWLSKNIRPGMLLVLTGLLIVEGVVMSCSVKLPPEIWTSTWQGWTIFAGIYGVVRSAEKITATLKR